MNNDPISIMFVSYYQKSRLTLTNSGALCEWIAGVSRWASANRIVIRCMAYRANAACVRTWIGAFTIDASAIVRTFRTDHTFGTTIGRRTIIIRLTRAHCMSICIATITIRSARRRLTWVVVLSWWRRHRNFSALEERIACETIRTCARRYVIVNVANGKSAANTNARIDTFECNTGQAIVAVNVCFTFASTSTIDIVRIALVSSVTEASAGTVTFTTLGIWPARRWTTWTCVWLAWNCCRTICKC